MVKSLLDGTAVANTSAVKPTFASLGNPKSVLLANSDFEHGPDFIPPLCVKHAIGLVKSGRNKPSDKGSRQSVYHSVGHLGPLPDSRGKVAR